jgi:hypothetical protein
MSFRAREAVLLRRHNSNFQVLDWAPTRKLHSIIKTSSICRRAGRKSDASRPKQSFNCSTCHRAQCKAAGNFNFHKYFID